MFVKRKFILNVCRDVKWIYDAQLVSKLSLLWNSKG